MGVPGKVNKAFKRQPTRLYVNGAILGYKRGQRNQHEHTSLIKISDVSDKASTEFYLGKRICYIYKAMKEVRGSKFRTIWGRVCASHGASGVIKAKFQRNLPPKSIGGRCRVMLYPSRV
ncbi:ribosomal protein L35A [Baffinella frigidus]|nr:ribosomal protein L35A [Cryptophyta sp. CCMP2293]